MQVPKPRKKRFHPVQNVSGHNGGSRHRIETDDRRFFIGHPVFIEYFFHRFVLQCIVVVTVATAAYYYYYFFSFRSFYFWAFHAFNIVSVLRFEYTILTTCIFYIFIFFLLLLLFAVIGFFFSILSALRRIVSLILSVRTSHHPYRRLMCLVAEFKFIFFLLVFRCQSFAQTLIATVNNTD